MDSYHRYLKEMGDIRLLTVEEEKDITKTVFMGHGGNDTRCTSRSRARRTKKENPLNKQSMQRIN